MAYLHCIIYFSVLQLKTSDLVFNFSKFFIHTVCKQCFVDENSAKASLRVSWGRVLHSLQILSQQPSGKCKIQNVTGKSRIVGCPVFKLSDEAQIPGRCQWLVSVPNLRCQPLKETESLQSKISRRKNFTLYTTGGTSHRPLSYLIRNAKHEFNIYSEQLKYLEIFIVLSHWLKVYLSIIFHMIFHNINLTRKQMKMQD